MRPVTTVRLADLTTLRVGGTIGAYLCTTTEEDLLAEVQRADAEHCPLLVIGDGSNLLASDDGFAGVVLQDARTGFSVDEGADAVRVTAVAGQDWDTFVMEMTCLGLAGLEALSGIPGTVGASPVQNIGAYGQDVARTIIGVHVWDRHEKRVKALGASDLAFGYRTSKIKRTMQLGGSVPGAENRWFPTSRYIVLDVTFELRRCPLSLPVAYAELARRLDIAVGERVPLNVLREAVLELRAAKGMLQDGRFGSPAGADQDRWSAGSFFTNPIVSAATAAHLPTEAPRYSVAAGRSPAAVKTSAAWLIEHAGFAKGYGVDGADSPATLSTKHTLALTNRGAATARDVIHLARTVQRGVLDAFGIALEPEPVLVGLTL